MTLPCNPQGLYVRMDTERLAPTMHGFLGEFDTLLKLVITTCLGTPSMMAQDRARVMEFWIQVAMVCHGTAPWVHPAILGPAPLLGQLSGWVLRSALHGPWAPPARGVRTWTRRPQG